MIIGAQMFTVRDFTKNLNDFSETLKKIADIGYTDVQVSGTCAYEPEWLAEELKKNGLTCSITHSYNMKQIIDDPQSVVKAYDTFNCKYVGIGAIMGGIENYFLFRDELKKSAQVLKAGGKLLMLHNHHREFQRFGAQNRTYLEQMMEDFAPDEAGITFDAYWAQVGGVNPAVWLKKLSGRVPCVHFKDMQIVNGEQRMAAIGDGNMDLAGILAAAEEAGCEHFLVEQDNCNGIDPFICLKRSYNCLRSYGLK